MAFETDVSLQFLEVSLILCTIYILYIYMYSTCCIRYRDDLISDKHSSKRVILVDFLYPDLYGFL